MEAARLMARGDLVFNAQEQAQDAQTDIDSSLASWGLYAAAPKAVETPTFYLWPESIEPFNFWRAMQTQWRIGQAGPEGLDYAGVWALLHNMVPFRKRKKLFEQITHMEGGALNGYAELHQEREAQ